VIGLSTVGVALLAVIVGSELALRGTKLQTGLLRVLVVWALVYLGAVSWLVARGDLSAIAFTIFWGGAFLSWFGVRSHIESSILLRMLVLLRSKPMTERGLVTDYTSGYGEAMRIEELCRGGFATRQHATLTLTPKGATILRVVAKLR
jgi:hypothetical protein